MPMPAQQQPRNSYEARWFIWTIVFLVVTGISLVSYIVLSDTGSSDIASVTAAKTPAKPAAHKTVSK